ncbi:hypothetical protein HDV05_005630 [Chytridiales sp. JEL 0842]|nr:hypothetical protein HDV05_005630 [Chytridiales sp. JEL 0842]
MSRKQRLLVLGSGWGGFQFLRGINQDLYDVIVVSPRNYFVFTPLLASTAVGTLEFRCVVEPVKKIGIEFYEASCENISFTTKTITCRSTLIDDHHPLQAPNGQKEEETFQIPYDILVIATGAVSNTFGIPGVKEHALFLKDIGDARKIRTKIVECFEHASQPNVPDSLKSTLLHFTIVGGGPTGIEFMGELHDFVTEDLLRLYPALRPFVKLTVFDVGKRILGGFDDKLAGYASAKFQRKGIQIRLQQRVKRVERNKIILETGEEVNFGMLVWSTGLTPLPLIKNLEVPHDPAMGRLVTDEWCRVIKKEGDKEGVEVLDRVFAIGDCATIKEMALPCTAQVASQKAVWLRKALNQKAIENSNEITSLKSFQYEHQGSLAYIGKWRALVDTTPIKNASNPTAAQIPKSKNPFQYFMPSSGVAAWLLWRSAYFTMSVSVKNKVLIPMFWFLTWIFGRDISRLR